MAILLDLADLTLNPQEADEVSKIVVERIYGQAELNANHRVDTGIIMKEQILLAGRIGLLGKKITGCKPPEDNKAVPMSQKYWEPIDWGFRMSHCAKDVNQLFKAFQRKMKRGDYNDLQGEQEMLFIISRVEDAMIENLNRLIWFGDTDMDIVDEGGYLADAQVADLPYWTVLDGLWPQVFAGVTSTDIPHYNITLNEAVSKAAQFVIPSGFALGIFRGLFEKADTRLRNAPLKKIFVTDSIAQEWITYLEDQSLAFSLAEVQDGITNLRYRGAEIVVRDDWDRHIVNFDDGTVYNFPHRALMTVADNIPIGTMDEESLTEVKSWFSLDDDVNYLQVQSRFDVKYLEGYMAVAAY